MHLYCAKTNIIQFTVIREMVKMNGPLKKIKTWLSGKIQDILGCHIHEKGFVSSFITIMIKLKLIKILVICFQLTPLDYALRSSMWVDLYSTLDR